MATYYRQRASAGLIVSEGTIVDARGCGFAWTPGIYTAEQATAWRAVTDAVHEAGGLIVCQLWHVGRQSHPDLLGGRRPLGPSAVASPESSPTPEGDRPHVVPDAMTTADIRDAVDQFRAAAGHAESAGFDGVEVHAAHGYLIDQFLRDVSNRRTDGYGGDVAGRLRFLHEVVDAVGEVWPASRVGVRLSPMTGYGGMSDRDPLALFTAAIESMNQRELAYVHLSRPRADAEFPLEPFAQACRRPLMVTGGFEPSRAEREIEGGLYQIAGVGRGFIANPDLPRRLAIGAAMNEPDPETFYGGGDAGYIDYPFLPEASVGPDPDSVAGRASGSSGR
jgi:N-ethylmaleimide reductase